MKFLPLLLIVMVGCAVRRPTGEERFLFPTDTLAPELRERVDGIMDEPSQIAPLTEELVRSTREVYQFLFDEMDFTCASARAIGNFRHRLDRTEAGFRLDDGRGMVIDLQRIYQDETRWVYLSEGTYRAPLVGLVDGDIVVVIHAQEETGGLRTRGLAYFKVTGRGEFWAKVAPRAVKTIMQRKGALFVDAAKIVVELSSTDPAAFVDKVRGAEGVDPAVLEKFRKSFIQ